MPSIPERHKTAARSAIIKVPGLSAMTATAKRAGGRTVCLCIARHWQEGALLPRLARTRLLVSTLWP